MNHTLRDSLRKRSHQGVMEIKREVAKAAQKAAADAICEMEAAASIGNFFTSFSVKCRYEDEVLELLVFHFKSRGFGCKLVDNMDSSHPFIVIKWNE